jgi:hypothetical protein
MNKSFTVVVAVLGLAACAAPKAWYKTGGTQQDFNKDQYTCMQESKQQVSSGYANAYGAATQSGMTVNAQMFGACMNARGWVYREAQSSAEGNACVGTTAYVGQTISTGDKSGTLTKIYGASERCRANPNRPILVDVHFK